MYRDSDRSGSGLRRSGFYQGRPNPGPDIGTLVGAAGKFMKSYKGNKDSEDKDPAEGKPKKEKAGPGLGDVAGLAVKYGPMILSMLG